ncbi:MAG: hypothetical protein WC586_07155 [Methanoregula sp.]
MDRQEHIHIISAGESIHTTYPAVLKELPTITHTFIFAEKEVYTNSSRDDASKRAWKCSIRNSIDAVNALCLSRNISCALVCIDAAGFDAIRDPVLGIYGEHPAARYSFDISAGSKRLSLGLFSLSLWVEGDSYYAFGNSPPRRVPVPTLASRNLPANPHYLLILTLLFRAQDHKKEAQTLVPKETLFNETRAWKVPGRDGREDSDSSELSPVTFSRLLSTLAGWNLIREETDPGRDHEKLYSLTPDGELALFVYSARIKKRGVAGTPGLT